MPALEWRGKSGELVVGGALRAVLRVLKDRARGLVGSDGAGLLVPRWLFLRVMGLIAFLNALDYLRFGQGMVGPRGLDPFGIFLRNIGAGLGTAWGLLESPSLLLLSPSAAALTAVCWLGVVSSLLVLFNIWPRAAVFVSWVATLSLVNASRYFSVFQHDYLICESLFLAVFLAPPGFRPGLGASAPPRPFVVFCVRWLLLRLMFESGMGKLLSNDPYWNSFTAMDVHQETSPFPTILGYYDHFLPHWYHVGEIFLMLSAELGGPLLILFAGRRGRIAAFFLWTVFQCGIELTGNYGFLNFNAMALGAMLIDDRFAAAVLARVGLGRFVSSLVQGGAETPPPLSAQGRALFYIPLVLSVSLSLLRVPEYFGMGKIDENSTLGYVLLHTQHLRIGTEYHLYRRYFGSRHDMTVQGSNDGGKTWRTYPFRYQANDDMTIPPFISPYFARFEAVLGLGEGFKDCTGRLAEGLIRGVPEVVALFASNPFPEGPPTRIAFPVFDVHFVKPSEHRATGKYWRRSYLEDFVPEARLDPNTGAIVRAH